MNRLHNGKYLEALLEIGNKTRISTLATNSQHCTRSDSQCNKIRRTNKRHQRKRREKNNYDHKKSKILYRKILRTNKKSQQGF